MRIFLVLMTFFFLTSNANSSTSELTKAVDDFKNTFSFDKPARSFDGEPQQRVYAEIKKPAICDYLQSTSLSVFKEDVNKKILTKNTKTLVGRVNRDNQEKKMVEEINVIIDDFKREFKRRPSIEEINDNLNEQVNYHFINNVLNTDND